MGAGYGPNIIMNGLIRNFDAENVRSYDGVVSTQWKDLSQYKAHATVNNAPIWTGKSFLFSNTTTNRTISLGNLNLSDYTVDVTFKAYLNNTDHRLLNTDSGTASQVMAISCGVNSGYLSIWSGSAWINVLSLSINTVYNLVITGTGSTSKVYINGNLVYTFGNKIGTAGNFILSSPYSGYGTNLNGQIYSCKIYNRALNDSEIKQNYNNHSFRYISPQIPTDNLSLWLKSDDGVMLDSSNSIAKWLDFSPAANHATASVTGINYGTYFLNRKAMVSFDGTAKFLTGSSGIFKNFFAVTRTRSPFNNYMGIWGQNGADLSVRLWQYLNPTYYGHNNSSDFAPNSNIRVNRVYDRYISNDNWHMVHCLSTTARTFSYAMPYTYSERQWKGELAELICYSTDITDDVRDQVELYLDRKWGIL